MIDLAVGAESILIFLVALLLYPFGKVEKFFSIVMFAIGVIHFIRETGGGF